jgi:hypothetical protein
MQVRSGASERNPLSYESSFRQARAGSRILLSHCRIRTHLAILIFLFNSELKHLPFAPAELLSAETNYSFTLIGSSLTSSHGRSNPPIPTFRVLYSTHSRIFAGPGPSRSRNCKLPVRWFPILVVVSLGAPLLARALRTRTIGVTSPIAN